MQGFAPQNTRTAWLCLQLSGRIIKPRANATGFVLVGLNGHVLEVRLKGCDCLILETPGPGGVAGRDLAQKVLADVVKLGPITLAELAASEAQPSAEMGALIVPFGAECDMAAIKAAIRHCRGDKGNLVVLGLASSCALAGQEALGDAFDTLVSLERRAAPDLLRAFVANQRVDLQNRAFRAFLDNSVDGYWIWYVKQDIIEWSARTCEMTGVDPAQTPHTMDAFVQLVHPQDRDRVWQAVNNHLQHGAPYAGIEMRLRNPAGRYGHFMASGQALRDEAGQAMILVGSLTDRTLIQRVEQQLEDTQRRFTVLFHQMNDAAVLADVETGIILEANQPAERLWGKSISELVGAHQTSLHPPNLDEEAREAFSRHIAALMQNQRATINVPVLRADGTEVPAEISSSLIEIEGRTTILGVFRDISERVRAERELRERDAQIQLSSHLASMGTLAAGVAHEINNPLTYVLGNLEIVRSLLLEKGIADPDLNEAIEAATTGGRFVREIVSDLKAISRMDGPDGASDPSEVIRIASRMAMSDLRHKAQLDLRLKETPLAQISSARLSQVVLNILSNAARAFVSTDRSENLIRVDVFAKDRRVHIVIADNGGGIAPEDLQRVWEPFFTKRGHSGGTGLGLSICRRILHEVNGTLDIASTLGQGTTVSMSIPILEGAAPDDLQAQPASPPSPAAPGARLRVMVVDDDTLITLLISRMLADDYEVHSFNDAREALAALSAGQSFDVILCDLMMPEMDGQSFYTRAKDAAPFLFVTGGAVTVENIAFERRMAAEGLLLHKPFEAQVLKRKLRDVVSVQAIRATPAPVVAAGDGPETTDADIWRPSANTLAELEPLLGRDGLREQLQRLAAQLDALHQHAKGLDGAALAQQAHRVAGAATVLGLEEMGTLLRAVQHAAAGGDVPAARQGLAQVSAALPGLRAFVQNY